MELFLRPTVIGGETSEGDFSVIHDGRLIGRIRRTQDHVHNTEVWSWTITVPLPMAAWSHGGSGSFEQAKEAFRLAWERFYDELSENDIAF